MSWSDSDRRARKPVRPLLNAQRWEIRRTAGFLLRELGGAEGLKELVPLLTDAEPLVRSEAVQGLMLNGTKEAAVILLDALTASKGKPREWLLAEVLRLRDHRAAPLYSYLVRQVSREQFPQLYLTAIEALGLFGGADAIEALKVPMHTGDWWRHRESEVRGATAHALSRIGTGHPEAVARGCARRTRGGPPSAPARRNGRPANGDHRSPAGACPSTKNCCGGSRRDARRAALRVDHPLLGRNVDGLLAALKTLQQQQLSMTVGIVDNEFVVADTPLPKTSAAMKDLIDKSARQQDGTDLVRAWRHAGGRSSASCSRWPNSRQKGGGEAPAWKFPHIRIGQITSEEQGRDGIASDMAAIRQLYTSAVSAAEAAWGQRRCEGKPDVPAALHAVEGLADAVTQNRTALVALTAMRNYDNYTFTHMVNVSILTMGQARALGIEGRLLREFGLSALMHDIGKVRTPKEILQKPERLTDQEFVIMRRHPVEGAEILRRTPEMPILAPVVAFEHHLRLDGTGYPEGAKRSALNLGTMICSIADVYDAMRSQRAYQQAFPTDRVLAVLKKDDGAHFDANLVRRFVQLLGIYPPGTLVKLQSDSVAVVTRVHAPDPYRPRVKVLFSPTEPPTTCRPN